MPKFNGKGEAMCDVEGCKNVATVNYQSGSARWAIDSTGYKFDEFYPDDQENEHKCDDHDAQGAE